MLFDNVTLTPPANASDDQVRAIQDVEAWLRGDVQEMTLGGYAGTGKTTLIRSIVDSLSDERVVVAAFTGKAVSVLQDKEIEAQTLHSLLYELEGAPEAWSIAREKWRATKKRLVAEGVYPSEGAVEKAGDDGVLNDEDDRAHTQWIFAQREYGYDFDPTPHWVDVPEIEAELVIVDEASMVSNQLYDSLRGHDARLLFVGDHGQLEPIGENPGLMMNPQIRLETIHRQAAGSEIIQFAHHLREGGEPRHWTGTGAEVIVNPREHVHYGDFDTIICGFNDRRVHLNRVVRNELGYSGSLPQVGEKLICLQNNRRKGIFNGLICECLQVEETDDDNVIRLIVTNAVGSPVTVLAWLPQFGEEKQAPYMGRHMSMFDWGYALTCHKMQGSEADNVVVVEQISYRWAAERWRYTAATRAAKKLTYLC